jgi:hypothetical protein
MTTTRDDYLAGVVEYKDLLVYHKRIPPQARVTGHK